MKTKRTRKNNYLRARQFLVVNDDFKLPSWTSFANWLSVLSSVAVVLAALATTYQAYQSRHSVNLMLEQVRLNKRLEVCEDLVITSRDLVRALSTMKAVWESPLKPSEAKWMRSTYLNNKATVLTKIDDFDKIKPRALLLYPNLRPIIEMYDKANRPFYRTDNELPETRGEKFNDFGLRLAMDSVTANCEIDVGGVQE